MSAQRGKEVRVEQPTSEHGQSTRPAAAKQLVPRWQIEQPQPDIMEAALEGLFVGKVRGTVSLSGRFSTGEYAGGCR